MVVHVAKLPPGSLRRAAWCTGNKHRTGPRAPVLSREQRRQRAKKNTQDDKADG